MSEQDALEHSKVWYYAADEVVKSMEHARRSEDWKLWRSLSAAAVLARSVGEGYEQLSEGNIGT